MFSLLAGEEVRSYSYEILNSEEFETVQKLSLIYGWPLFPNGDQPCQSEIVLAIANIHGCKALEIYLSSHPSLVCLLA
jgi:hypothetical protein